MQLISKYKIPLFLSFFYLLFRLINLTKLPIFNDEAIYLNWGWVEVHKPGFLYYSLYDAKQPFLMWIFGIFQTLLPDPLFAGRFVSVIAGFLTMVGIYKISEKYFSKQTALLASLIYIVVPIFAFYDRQALMEAAISTVGIWSLYYFLRTLEAKNIKNAALLGIVLGIGFFIKSSAIIFILATFLIYAYYILKTKDRKLLLKSFFITLTTILLVDLILLINPQFWKTISTNNRYGFTFDEILHFPIITWVNNFLGNLEIAFAYLTPIILVASLTGIYFIFRKIGYHKKILLSWLLITFFLQTLMSKGTSTRYVASFLPVLSIPAAYAIDNINQRLKIHRFFLYLISILIPAALSILLVINPIKYVTDFTKISRYSEMQYVVGQTSGVNINETVDYLKKLTDGKQVYVDTALNTGNPESALAVYFEKSENIKVFFLDSQLFRNSLDNYKCLRFDRPVYFVARDQQQGGLNRFFIKLTSFKNPYSNYSIGIYKIDENCKGPAINISEN